MTSELKQAESSSLIPVFSGQTHPGRVRQKNEDAFWIGPGAGAAIVSDGMGGHAGGEVASRIVVQTFEQVMQAGLGSAASLEEAQARLSRAFELANRAVRQAIQEDPSRHGMGATAVCACLWNGKAVIGHVGDSRAYLIRAGEIVRLTRDHSLVQILLDGGTITEAQAHTHPQRNLITQALGTQAKITPDLRVVEVSPQDCLLLCSDGLTNEVEDREIRDDILASSSGEEVCDRLIRQALQAGGHDNVTAVIVQIST